MSKEATVEYLPQAVAGNITVQRGPDRVMITIRPSLRRILKAMVPGLGMLGFSVVLVAIFQIWGVGGRTTRWGALVFPGIFAVCALAAIAERIWLAAFSIVFEVTAESFCSRWRKLTEAGSFEWPRNMITGVRVDRLKVNQSMWKRLVLVVHYRGTGDVVVHSGPRRELMVIAEQLQQALGVRGEVDAAPCATPGSRCKPTKWRDGVRVYVPPRWNKTVNGALVVLVGMGALFALHVLNRYVDDDSVQNPGAAWYAKVALALIVGAIVWVGLSHLVGKVRRRTVLAADARKLYVAETDLFRPLSVEWKHNEVTMAVEEGERGTGTLVITPRQGAPLTLLKGERLSDLQWLVKTLEAARQSTGG
jgi:hypothetical protein